MVKWCWSEVARGAPSALACRWHSATGLRGLLLALLIGRNRDLDDPIQEQVDCLLHMLLEPPDSQARGNANPQVLPGRGQASPI